MIIAWWSFLNIGPRLNRWDMPFPAQDVGIAGHIGPLRRTGETMPWCCPELERNEKEEVEEMVGGCPSLESFFKWIWLISSFSFFIHSLFSLMNALTPRTDRSHFYRLQPEHYDPIPAFVRNNEAQARLLALPIPDRGVPKKPIRWIRPPSPKIQCEEIYARSFPAPTVAVRHVKKRRPYISKRDGPGTSCGMVCPQRGSKERPICI